MCVSWKLKCWKATLLDTGERQFTYSVTLRPLRVTMFAVESNEYYLF